MIEKMAGVIAMVVAPLLRQRPNGLLEPMRLIKIAQQLEQRGRHLYAPVSQDMGAI